MRRDLLWNTAEVEDGTLTVWLSGPPDANPQEWEMWSAAFEKARLQESGGLLTGPNLGIELIRGAITVRGVDDADDVGDRLDRLVPMANDQYEADLTAERQRAEQAQSEATQAAVRDEQLRQRFRQRGGS